MSNTWKCVYNRKAPFNGNIIFSRRTADIELLTMIKYSLCTKLIHFNPPCKLLFRLTDCAINLLLVLLSKIRYTGSMFCTKVCVRDIHYISNSGIYLEFYYFHGKANIFDAGP